MKKMILLSIIGLILSNNVAYSMTVQTSRAPAFTATRVALGLGVVGIAAGAGYGRSCYNSWYKRTFIDSEQSLQKKIDVKSTDDAIFLKMNDKVDKLLKRKVAIPNDSFAQAGWPAQKEPYYSSDQLISELDAEVNKLKDITKDQ